MSQYFETAQDLKSDVTYQIKPISNESFVPKKFCTCCLSETLDFLSTFNCSHYDYYKQFFDIKNLHEGGFICVICHEMLKKIVKFNNMILESYHILANNTNLQNHSRKKYIDLQISKKSAILSIEYNGNLIYKKPSNVNLDQVINSTSINGFQTNQAFNIVPITKESAEKQEKSKMIMIMPYCKPGPSTSNNSLLSLMLTSDSKIKPPVYVRDPVPSEPTDPYPLPIIKPELVGKIKSVFLTQEEYEKEREERMNASEHYQSCEYKCTYCILGYTNKEVYEEHIKNKHTFVKKHYEVNKKQCPHCKKFVNPPICAHEQRHFIRFECCVCKYRCKQMKTVLKHYSENHDDINARYDCRKCQYTATNRAEYKRHIDTHNEYLPCEKCGKTFKDKHILRQHDRLVHLDVISENSPQCKICKKKFCSNNYLRFHTNNTHKEINKVFACEICKSVYKNEVLLKRHYAIHEKQFTCDECGKRYASKFMVKRHILSVHLKVDMSVVCPICGKTCTDKLCLQSHKRNVHSVRLEKIKKLLCQYCGKEFTRRGILKCHLNTHTGARPFACKYCTATFAQSGALYKHTELRHHKGKRKGDMQPDGETPVNVNTAVKKEKQ